MSSKNELVKQFLWTLEDGAWNIRCRYQLWLHGPYGLARIIEKMPFRYLIKYLCKYGATVGDFCRFERGINIHRPLGKRPFENLHIGNNVYLGHNTLLDLSRPITLHDRVIIASRCQLWTHASYYGNSNVQDPHYGEKYGAITIKEGALIYSGAVVKLGVTIGRFAIVGACSFVNADVPDHTFVGGVPAKKIQRPASEIQTAL